MCYCVTREHNKLIEILYLLMVLLSTPLNKLPTQVMATQKGQSPNEKVKIIWINHVIHTKTETQYQDNTWRFLTPAGQMIRGSVGKLVGSYTVFIIGKNFDYMLQLSVTMMS